MVYEILTAAEFAPALSNSSAVLHAYARPREGFLAENGGRWGVLILPGGGYGAIAKSESEPIALAFLGAGIQAFVLEYSIAPARWPRQLLETASALAYLREHAERYGIAPDKVAVCGFSAGGHLAGCIANLWDHKTISEPLDLNSIQARPDAVILSYPVISMGALGSSRTRANLFGNGPIANEASLEVSVTRRNPPAFIWATATDDLVAVENSMLYAGALRANKIPFEFHIFDKGPHAMGLATPDSAWSEDHTSIRVKNWFPLCVSWLKGLG